MSYVDREGIDLHIGAVLITHFTHELRKTTVLAINRDHLT